MEITQYEGLIMPKTLRINTGQEPFSFTPFRYTPPPPGGKGLKASKNELVAEGSLIDSIRKDSDVRIVDLSIGDPDYDTMNGMALVRRSGVEVIQTFYGIVGGTPKSGFRTWNGSVWSSMNSLGGSSSSGPAKSMPLTTYVSLPNNLDGNTYTFNADTVGSSVAYINDIPIKGNYSGPGWEMVFRDGDSGFTGEVTFEVEDNWSGMRLIAFTYRAATQDIEVRDQDDAVVGDLIPLPKDEPVSVDFQLINNRPSIRFVREGEALQSRTGPIFSESIGNVYIYDTTAASPTPSMTVEFISEGADRTITTGQGTSFDRYLGYIPQGFEPANLSGADTQSGMAMFSPKDIVDIANAHIDPSAISVDTQVLPHGTTILDKTKVSANVVTYDGLVDGSSQIQFPPWTLPLDTDAIKPVFETKIHDPDTGSRAGSVHVDVYDADTDTKLFRILHVTSPTSYITFRDASNGSLGVADSIPRFFPTQFEFSITSAGDFKVRYYSDTSLTEKTVLTGSSVKRVYVRDSGGASAPNMKLQYNWFSRQEEAATNFGSPFVGGLITTNYPPLPDEVRASASGVEELYSYSPNDIVEIAKANSGGGEARTWYLPGMDFDSGDITTNTTGVVDFDDVDWEALNVSGRTARYGATIFEIQLLAHSTTGLLTGDFNMDLMIGGVNMAVVYDGAGAITINDATGSSVGGSLAVAENDIIQIKIDKSYLFAINTTQGPSLSYYHNLGMAECPIEAYMSVYNAGSVGIRFAFHREDMLSSSVLGATLAETLDQKYTEYTEVGRAISSRTSSTNVSRGVVLSSQGVLNDQDYTTAWGNTTSSIPSTANVKARVTSSTGVGYFLGGTTTSGSDYAEYFRHEYPGGIPVGTIVVQEGSVVRPGIGGDNPDAIVGIISSNPSVVGNDAPEVWHDKDLRDEFGGLIYEDVEVVRIGDREVLKDSLEVIPEDAEIFTIKQTKTNPMYDSEAVYIPRSERPDEWVLVGMVGQLHTRVYEDITSAYVSADGRSSDVVTRIRLMEMLVPFSEERGYGVARCLMR